jgi:hypothetical protein
MKVGVVLALAALLAAGCESNPTEPSPVSCNYVVVPDSFTPCMTSSQGTVAVVTGTGCAWTATPTASWIGISGQAGGTGSGTFGFAVAENYAPPRQAVIHVQRPGASDSQTITVAQGGCLYVISPVSTIVQAAGAGGSFDVFPMAQPYECGGPTQDRCVWTAQTDAPWITVLSGAGNDIAPVNFRVAANDSPSSRSGTIIVRDKVFQITQLGR